MTQNIFLDSVRVKSYLWVIPSLTKIVLTVMKLTALSLLGSTCRIADGVLTTSTKTILQISFGLSKNSLGLVKDYVRLLFLYVRQL